MDINEEINIYLEKNREEIIKNFQKLVQIPTVANFDEKDCPYGSQCKKGLDFCMNLAEEKGLTVKNFDYRCAEALFYPEPKGKRLVIATHADVVSTEDDEMIYPPFDGKIVENYVIGRGSVDDKGPLIATLYGLAFFKEKNIELNNDIRLFFGSNEEKGMDDIKYYLEKVGQPDLGLAADDDFPVVNGEKGILDFFVSFKKSPEAEVRSFGTDKALIHNKIKITDGKGTRILINEEKSPRFLQEAIGENIFLNPEDHKLFTELCLSENGEKLGIFRKDSVSGETKLRFYKAETVNDEIILHFDVRTPVSFDLEEAENIIKSFFKEKNVHFEIVNGSKGFFLPSDNEYVALLTNLYNENTNSDEKPYVMGACTYARMFKTGMGFGTGNPHETKPFPAGHGGAHGPDEAHNIDVLMNAVRMYILGIKAIDDYWQNNN